MGSPKSSDCPPNMFATTKEPTTNGQYSAPPPSYAQVSQQPIVQQQPQFQQFQGQPEVQMGGQLFGQPGFPVQQTDLGGLPLQQQPLHRLGDVFDFGQPDYGRWCLLQFCCSGFSMVQMGKWLKERSTCIYLLVWIIALMLQVGLGAIDHMLMYADENGVIDMETAKLLKLIALLLDVVSIGVSVWMASLIVNQRQLFLQKFGFSEDRFNTWLLACFCSPCLYGQMGSFKTTSGVEVSIV